MKEAYRDTLMQQLYIEVKKLEPGFEFFKVKPAPLEEVHGK